MLLLLLYQYSINTTTNTIINIINIITTTIYGLITDIDRSIDWWGYQYKYYYYYYYYTITITAVPITIIYYN